MKKIKTENAVGQVLFHDLTAILENGYKGVRFKRGHIIKEEDIDVLLDMGKEHLYVEDGNEDLIHEEDAAFYVAKASIGENIKIEGPSEGKYSLISSSRGLFHINREGLNKINETQDYTFASLFSDTPVEEGDILAGARIIPLETAKENVDQALNIAKSYTPIFSVIEYKEKKVGIIVTGSEIYKGRKKDAFYPILKEKLEKNYPAKVFDPLICPDDHEFIIRAIDEFLNKADIILITGGMSVDPDDLTPSIIEEVSDEIFFHGLPVQPGNMLTIGKKKDTFIIGVPGASMHSKITSLDIFLPKIFADLSFDKKDAILLGEGGLTICKQWPRKL